MSEPVSIIYTANLNADLDVLPVLFTAIQQIRRECADNNPPHHVLLLDIGGASSDDSWLCQATEHRAMYVLLDAMGYGVAFADALDLAGILGLQSAVQLRLLNTQLIYSWTWRNVIINIGQNSQPPAIRWESNRQEEQAGIITLDAPPKDHFGRLDIQWPAMEIMEETFIPFDRSLRPNPTIVAAIDFVKREARHYQQKTQGNQYQ